MAYSWVRNYLPDNKNSQKNKLCMTENIGIHLRVIQHLIFNIYVLYWCGDPAYLFLSKVDEIFKKRENWEALM